MMPFFRCAALLFLWVPSASAQSSIPAFPLQANDLELTRLAQPGTPFDKAGRRFAVLGEEGGSFEAWAYPLKLFRNVRLAFLIGSSTEPVPSASIVRRISVTPEATRLTYTFQSFTVHAVFITPIDEPGGFLLLDVDANEPLTIVCSFLPVLQPMWPAGIGGQSARWLSDIKAYQISEPTRRNHAYIGSPAAAGISYTPAHMLSDRPNEFKIVVDKPQSLRGRYVPIVMAGGRGSRDSIRAIYTRLASDPERHYRQAVDHYRTLRQSTLQISTPVSRLNLAFEWAKVAYDNLLVHNPDVGLGMVAGLGASGTSGRPGFGWFFGGDTYINSFSLNAAGAHQHARDAIAFTHQWQRADGKMAHELTQAAAYVDWWNDYPYGYIHGDTSPFYVCAVWDYFTHTADSAFVRSSWPTVRKAYEWSRATDLDGDGLMDNKAAGLGALEYGPLTDIQSDIYTSAVWVRALFAMPSLARVAGDSAFATTAQRYYENALTSFDRRFWDDQRQQYAYAFTSRGEHVDIVSPWSSVGLMWELGDPARSMKSLIKLSSSELSTDWGVRSISNRSSYFEPLNYNYGAVWPFLSSWVATAQFRHHLSLQGYAMLMASVEHTFDNALGAITEVFSGTHNIWPQEAVSHQGFSSASVILPTVRGLFGLLTEAHVRHLHFSPHLPADWPSVRLANVRLGSAVVALDYVRTRTKVTLKVKGQGAAGNRLIFAPALGVGTTVGKARVDGKETAYRLIVSSQTVQPLLETDLTDEMTVDIDIRPTVELLPPAPLAKTGDPNMSLKILGVTRKDQTLTVVTEGRAGMTYDLGLVNEDLVAGVRGGTLQSKKVVIAFPPQPGGEYVRREIAIDVKPPTP